MCSQRSGKSVRIELTKDRKALEEVRDAEDKIDQARKSIYLYDTSFKTIIKQSGNPSFFLTEKHLNELHNQHSRSGNSPKLSEDIQKATETLSKAKEGHKEKLGEYEAICKSKHLIKAISHKY